MRENTTWRDPIARRLRPWRHQELITLSDFIDTELALCLLHAIAPDWPTLDAWTLFTGYPYTAARGVVLDEDRRLRLERARFRIASLRHQSWRDRLEAYQQVPEELRAFIVDDLASPPQPRTDRAASRRRDEIASVLDSVPDHLDQPLEPAAAGEYLFRAGERQHSVVLSEQDRLEPPALFATDEPLRGGGKGITLTRADLHQAASDMDGLEVANPFLRKRNDWVGRLIRFELLVRSDPQGPFLGGAEWSLTVEGLMHLVGMVGAGKSTFRDLAAFHCVHRLGLRVGLVVPDVAESLAVVNTLNAVGLRAAPIIGESTKGTHLRRLHQRQTGAEAPTLLHHRHPSFAYLSSACPLDAARGREAKRPLEIHQTPCTGLIPLDDRGNATADRNGCPLWSKCPRHHAWRELQQADVWVANPASLVYTPVSRHQSARRLRVLELMSRSCDLIVIDEADRVQLQFDTTFAPALTLYGRGRDSWLDELTGHQIRELADSARSQLADGLADQWLAAISAVNTAANQIFSMLLGDRELREWVGIEYFSAYTLHFRLLSEWFGPAEEPEDESAERDRASAILDRFRDDPFGSGDAQYDGLTPADATILDRLASAAVELVGVGFTTTIRERLHGIIRDLTGAAADERHSRHLRFTILVAVLHHRLNFLTWGWERVESKLNLHATANPLRHKPPSDYEPIMAESPIGNVLGFQFLIDDLDESSEGGSLKFFRCLGLGRELLRRLDAFARVDGRPAPHVILMSATSWAGQSTRYHLGVPVTAVLRPRQEEIERIAQSEFRKEPVWDEQGVPLRVSGTHPRDRAAVLQKVLKGLAAPEGGIGGGDSRLDLELRELEQADPDRARILLVTGSYAETRAAFEYLDGLPRWRGKVLRLVADDDGAAWGTLRRGDVRDFPDSSAELLIAPLLAIERGHNIVVEDGKAAFGTAYFLVRPHDPPDDINLAIHALNDWAVRMVDDGRFASLVRHAASADQAAAKFRRLARERWRFLLHRRPTWSTLDPQERVAFTWDQMVSIWQVIGRLVRGGVPARVKFVDAAFAPKEAAGTGTDTAADSLIASMQDVLRPYFTDDPTVAPGDRYLVRELYFPLYRALTRIDG